MNKTKVFVVHDQGNRIKVFLDRIKAEKYDEEISLSMGRSGSHKCTFFKEVFIEE